jgi:hypothetical protein
MTKKVINAEAGTLEFQFDDGETVSFDTSAVAASIKARAMLHGFSQKLGDSYASASKAENPLAWAKQTLKDTIAQLMAGDWRAAVGEAGPRVTDLAIAISRLTGKPIEAAVEFVDSLDEDQLAVFRAKPKVKAMLAEVRAEKAAERARKAAEAAKAAEEAGADDGDLGI